MRRLAKNPDTTNGMTILPKLSIRLHGLMTPHHCVRLAMAADAAGFASAWFAENAFARGILPAAAACAIATRRLRIGAGVFNPFSRHPTMMAMEAGALDELAGGRVVLCLGSGIGSAVEKIGHVGHKPLLALRDTLAIVRGLLRGEQVSHAGKAFSAQKVKLDYTPRPDLPVFLAGRGELILKLCGEAADGLLVSNMCSLSFASRAAAAVQDARGRAGRPGSAEIVQYMPCAVSEDRTEALCAAKRAVGEMVPVFWALSQRLDSAREALLAGTGLSAEDFSAAAARIATGGDAAEALSENFALAFALAGTPEDCLDQATRYAAGGITELALTFDSPAAEESIALLGKALAVRRAAGARPGAES